MIIHDPEDFPITQDLKENYLAILEEFRKIEPLMQPWRETHLYGNTRNWNMFGLFAKFTGTDVVEVTENTQLCPVTTSIIKKHLTNYGCAAFSKFAPKTELNPHKGFKEPHLRLHLGLDVPKGDLGLQVEDHVFTWANGEVFLFDDTLEHFAWNRSDKERSILMIDIIPNSMRNSNVY